MRVTIIPVDNFVSVNGVGFSTIDLSFIPPNIHAVQWHGTWGIVEIKDIDTGAMVENQYVNSIEVYQLAIDRWTIAKQMQDEKVVTPEEVASLEVVPPLEIFPEGMTVTQENQ